MTVVLVALALAAPPPKLVADPPQLVAGQTWTATIVASAPPQVEARLGAKTVAFRARRVAARRYRAMLVFSAPGTWRLSATVAGRSTLLARVRVLASYPLALPAGILVREDGSLLVVERGGRDRVLHVQTDGRFTIFARDVPSPWGLAAADEGVLVSGGGGIYRVSAPRAPAQRVLSLDASPFVVAPGGDIYYANATEVGRVRTGTTRAEPFQLEVSVPHGLALEGDTLYVSDSGNGRILRVDVRTGRSAVYASGLRSALGIELEPGGSLLAAEHDTGRLLRIDLAGHVSVVASRLVNPYAVDRSPDGSVFVVESGDERRATGAIARVGVDGTLTRLRLVPG